MAIGTAMAVGLGAAALGGAMGAKSKKKAAKKAAQFSQTATNDNNALAGQVYQQGTNALAPYTQAGNPAGTQMNALLGVGGNQAAADSAFQQYLGSSGYQFRLGEGMNALNSGYAGAGVLQSGAAMRGAQEYGQNFASNEFGNYMQMLDNQQRLGLSATLGQAGLGQSYVGTVTNNNWMNADNQGNAALIRGQNNPFATALSGIGGTLMSGGLKF
jgi:hypothetical protein